MDFMVVSFAVNIKYLSLLIFILMGKPFILHRDIYLIHHSNLLSIYANNDFFFIKLNILDPFHLVPQRPHFSQMCNL